MRSTQAAAVAKHRKKNTTNQLCLRLYLSVCVSPLLPQWQSLLQLSYYYYHRYPYQHYNTATIIPPTPTPIRLLPYHTTHWRRRRAHDFCSLYVHHIERQETTPRLLDWRPPRKRCTTVELNPFQTESTSRGQTSYDTSNKRGSFLRRY